MKKNTCDRLGYFQIIRLKNLKRIKKLRKRRIGSLKHRGRSTIYAPISIDLYRVENHKKMCVFLRRMSSVLINGDDILISFRETLIITASGGILLMAEVDRLIRLFGQRRIKSTFFSNFNGEKGRRRLVAESVLNRIGFYRLLGQSSRQISEQRNVKCWNAISGSTADGSLASRILDEVREYIPNDLHRNLYRGAIEALSNSVEHAYMGERDDGLSIDYRDWWMFTAFYDDTLVVLVADLGVGIPNTIRKTQKDHLLHKLFQQFGFDANSDSEWIKAATLVKETRTLESNRGKGGGDLRSLVKKGENASLNIFSNKGRYRFSKSKTNKIVREGGDAKEVEVIFDNKYSIYGTIVEWSIKV